MNTEIRETIQKIMVELFQERLVIINKINDDDYQATDSGLLEKDTDNKCIVEMDKVIQSILDYLKHF